MVVSDVAALQTATAELAQAIANMQRAVDQIQQQQVLQNQAILNVIRGRWDAAQFGTQSVESMLVALDPSLQGKANPVPFPAGRSPRPSST